MWNGSLSVTVWEGNIFRLERKFQHRPAHTPTTHKVSLYACACVQGVVTFQGFRFFRESTHKNQWFQRPVRQLPSWQAAFWKFLKHKKKKIEKVHSHAVTSDFIFFSSLTGCGAPHTHTHSPQLQLISTTGSESDLVRLVYNLFRHPDNFKTMPIYV